MTAAAGDAHEFPIFGARFRVAFPILDADGDPVTGATALDSEISQDGGSFADCSNEATEIGSTGIYLLDLIFSELDNKQAIVRVQTSSSGAKTAILVLNPRRLPVIETGTAQAGASGSITLAAGASDVTDYYVGMYVNITNNTPSNVQGQCRLITAYNGSTKVATVEANWGTNPSSSSTYEVLAPPHMSMNPGQLADHLLRRNLAGGASTPVDASNVRTVQSALRTVRNKVTVSAGTMTVYREDDTTTAYTAVITDNASANPIVGVDPA